MTWRTLMQNKYFLYFIIFPFFTPYSFRFIPSLAPLFSINTYWKLLAVLIIFFLYLLRGKLSKMMAIIIGIHFALFLSSLLNGLKGQAYYSDLLPTLALPFLIELGIEVNIKKVLQTIFNILALLTGLNFILTLAYPQGLPFAVLYTQTRNPLYFLGLDNGIVYTLLTLLGINYLLREINPNTYTIRLQLGYRDFLFVPRLFIFNLIAIITMLIVGSATGLVILSLFLLLVKFSYGFKKKNQVWVLFTLYLLFFITVVVLGNQNPFLANLTSLLGRDAGFTGRSVLWSRSLELIRENLWLGSGNNPDIINIWGQYFSAHNQLLDIAIRGGLITLFLFIWAHFVSFKNLRNSSTYTANILFVTIYCFLLGGLMESSVRPTHFLFLMLANYPTLSYYLHSTIQRGENDD